MREGLINQLEELVMSHEDGSSGIEFSAMGCHNSKAARKKLRRCRILSRMGYAKKIPAVGYLAYKHEAYAVSPRGIAQWDMHYLRGTLDEGNE